MMRKSVVLPDPDGPNSATSSPSFTRTLTSRSAVNVPYVFQMCLTSMLIARFHCRGRLGPPCRRTHVGTLEGYSFFSGA